MKIDFGTKIYRGRAKMAVTGKSGKSGDSTVLDKARKVIGGLLTAGRGYRAGDISERLVALHQAAKGSPNLRRELSKACSEAGVSPYSEDPGDRLVELLLASASAAMRTRYKQVLRVAAKRQYTPDGVRDHINKRGLIPFLNKHKAAKRQKGKGLSDEELDQIIAKATKRVRKSPAGEIKLNQKETAIGWRVVLAYHDADGITRVYRHTKIKRRVMARLIDQYT